MQAGSKIGKPRSRSKGGNDPVTLPDRHAKSAAINQRHIAKTFTHMRRRNRAAADKNPKYENNCTARVRDVIGNKTPTYIEQGNICLDGISVTPFNQTKLDLRSMPDNSRNTRLVPPSQE